jgi:ParB family chromosome partitioning protein
LSPPEYIEAARRVLGEIDLDPASCAKANRMVQAKRHFTKEQNGLTQEWAGRVFLNPPFSAGLIEQFARKLIESPNITAAVMLANSCTETCWFHRLLARASAVCFPSGRIKFVGGNVSSGPMKGQAVFYLGAEVAAFEREFSRFGSIIRGGARLA